MFKNKKLDVNVLIISGGLLIAFVIASLIDMAAVTKGVDILSSFAIKYFGGYWQLLLLGTFLVAIIMAISSLGNVKLGNLNKPEIGYFKWLAMIMTTLLAGGGVFWAAAEPMYHFMSSPPSFELENNNASTNEVITAAFAQSYLHWGFLAWAILGTLSTIVLMYVHYEKGLPLKPRSLLYPIFGEKIMKKSVLGTFVDAFSIISVAAGTIGPIGFLGLQAAYGLQALLGIPNTLFVQYSIIVGVVLVAILSAVSGFRKGIQFLSNLNIGLTLVLMIFIVILGPGMFILDSYISSTGVYLQNFFSISTYRGDADWLGSWTIFFWGWFLGYGPMMAIFISTISRGRTIRELIFTVALIAPFVTAFWFTVVGGTGIFHELLNPGVISDKLYESGMPAAMIAITQQLPLSSILGPAFLIVTILFVITTTDSMSYTISVAITGMEKPARTLRIFWAITMGVVAMILLSIGEGGIGALQSFILVTAIPVSLFLLPLLWTAPKIALLMKNQQK